MWRRLFDPEALFWRWMSALTDVLVLSLLWLLTSLPLLTLGAATAALYDAAVRCVRTGTSGAWRRYLHTFRAELPTATVATVLWGGLLALQVWALDVLWRIVPAGGAGVLAAAAGSAALIVPAGTFCWMFPLLSRFTFSLRGLLWTSLQFSLAHLPSTILILAAAGAAFLANELLLVPILVTPCLTALFWSLLMERAFRKHLPDPPEDPDSPGPVP